MPWAKELYWKRIHNYNQADCWKWANASVILAKLLCAALCWAFANSFARDDPEGANRLFSRCKRRYFMSEMVWLPMILVELYTTVLPAVFSVSVFCWYQICWAFGIFGRYCCTVRFGRNTFLRFRGNSFLEKFCGNSFFSSKGGRSVQKGGGAPPFLGKRGLPPFFWGAPAKVLIPKIPTEIFSGIGFGNTEKYRPIPTEKYRFGIQL